MSKKIKKSSGKKVKSAKPAKKVKAKKVFANKKNAVKKAGKKAAPAKKAAPSKKTVSKAKPAKTTGKVKTKPKTAAKKPAGKAISKAVAKTVVKAVDTIKSAPKTTVKSGPTAKAKASAPVGKKPAADLTAQAAKNTASSIKSNPSSNNKPVQALKTVAKTVVEDNKNSNDPPGKFELEYVIHSSAELLFNFLTEPSGLSEWFCDDVNIRHGIYTFFWDGSQQQAKEIKFIPDRCIRFQWIEKHDGTYFEFRIEKDELTSDISLIITDFAESEDDRKSLKLLWDSQIDKLLHVMGAYF